MVVKFSVQSQDYLKSNLVPAIERTGKITEMDCKEQNWNEQCGRQQRYQFKAPQEQTLIRSSTAGRVQKFAVMYDRRVSDHPKS